MELFDQLPIEDNFEERIMPNMRNSLLLYNEIILLEKNEKKKGSRC